MSQMSTVPVLYCKRCGRPFKVTHLSTRMPDPEGVLLGQLMANLNKLPCPTCQRQKQYYIDQGRGEEWEKGNL